MSVFSERLKELRGNEAQASFAKQIGIHAIQYSKYERGVNSPSIEVLERICRVHACSSDWLLGLDRKTGATIVQGDGNAVAIGPHSRASVTPHSALGTPHSSVCRKCPYMSWGRKFIRAGGSIPGIS